MLLLLGRAVARAAYFLVHAECVLRSCRVLFLAGCVWCVVCVCLWCSCGGVSSVCYPLVVVVGGGIVDGGVALRGGVA